MRFAAFLMPLFALISGAAGYYLRLSGLMNAFETRTGLPIHGASITYVLIAVSAAFLVLALAFCIRASVKRQVPGGFENAFGTDPLTYPFAFGIIGLVWLGATVKYFLDVRATGILPMVDIYFSVLSALAAISVSFFAVEMYQDPRRKSVYALSIIPTIFMCFWLVIMYRQNATNPVLLKYAYYCLAIIAAALSFYYTSGFVYNKPSPGKTMFFYFAAIYFCFVTLADDHSVTLKIIFAAIIAMNVVYSSKLIKQMRRKSI